MNEKKVIWHYPQIDKIIKSNGSSIGTCPLCQNEIQIVPLRPEDLHKDKCPNKFLIYRYNNVGEVPFAIQYRLENKYELLYNFSQQLFRIINLTKDKMVMKQCSFNYEDYIITNIDQLETYLLFS